MTPAEFIEKQYKIQNGMFFSGKMTLPGFILFNSRILETPRWNYARLRESGETDADAAIRKAETLFHRLGRKSCFYFAEDEPIPELITAQYRKDFKETWFKYENKLQLPQAEEAILVSNAEQMELFIRLNKATRSDKRAPTVLKSRESTYPDALRQSFGYPNYYNFIIFSGGQPAAVATLGYCENCGGIYNLGTLAEYRGRSMAKMALKCCIDIWHKLGGKELFLQLPERVSLEGWCRQCGFVPFFAGTAYSREIVD